MCGSDSQKKTKKKKKKYAKCKTKDLKGRDPNNSFLVLDVYPNEKSPSVQIRLLNIFKNRHILDDIFRLIMTNTSLNCINILK